MVFLDDKPAFELSFWCGTCQFLFQRLDGANDTLSLDGLRDRLSHGLDDLDQDVIESFAAVLPPGRYLPMLLSIRPRLTLPMKDGDYFAEEQVSTWGVNSFWGLPEYPHTAYYRTFEASVDRDAHLFEFVVPMLPPAWNDADTVAAHAQRLATSDRPTAVAVSTLDVCQPAMATFATDYYAHWGLTHFLLDGHHKMQAAATTGQPLRFCPWSPSTAASPAKANSTASSPCGRSPPGDGSPGRAGLAKIDPLATRTSHEAGE